MLQTVLKKAIIRGVRASGEPIAFTPEAMVADQLVDVRRRVRSTNICVMHLIGMDKPYQSTEVGM